MHVVVVLFANFLRSKDISLPMLLDLCVYTKMNSLLNIFCSHIDNANLFRSQRADTKTYDFQQVYKVIVITKERKMRVFGLACHLVVDDRDDHPPNNPRHQDADGESGSQVGSGGVVPKAIRTRRGDAVVAVFVHHLQHRRALQPTVPGEDRITDHLPDSHVQGGGRFGVLGDRGGGGAAAAARGGALHHGCFVIGSSGDELVFRQLLIDDGGWRLHALKSSIRI
mgnify:CR=1 FL=1